MDKKRVGQFNFVFKRESIIMQHNHQYIAFHTFTTARKRELKFLEADIKKSRHMDIERVFSLAAEHGVPAMNTIESSMRSIHHEPGTRIAF